jgi:hypothetical protein
LEKLENPEPEVPVEATDFQEIQFLQIQETTRPAWSGHAILVKSAFAPDFLL